MLTRKAQLLKARLTGELEAEIGVGYTDAAGRFVPVETCTVKAQVYPYNGNQHWVVAQAFMMTRAEGEVRWLTHKGIFIDSAWRTVNFIEPICPELGDSFHFSIVTTLPDD